MAGQVSPSMRGSSNEQDTAGTTAEMAVQGRPPRSIPKALIVRQVMPSIVRSVIEQEHYLHAMPAGSRACFGVYLDGSLVGAVVFTTGSRYGHRVLGGGKPDDVVTLARLWLSDGLPSNSESRVLGIVLRHLRRETSWKLVLSYADPAAGHVGTIYQASGWRYLGLSEPTSYVRLADGALHHPRTVSNRYGSNGIRHLQATGISARRELMAAKHRYAYLLDPAWTWRVHIAALPYPQKLRGG